MHLPDGVVARAGVDVAPIRERLINPIKDVVRIWCVIVVPRLSELLIFKACRLILNECYCRCFCHCRVNINELLLSHVFLKKRLFVIVFTHWLPNKIAFRMRQIKGWLAG